jgi:putative transposase
VAHDAASTGGVHSIKPICAVLPIAPSTYFLRKAQQQDATKRSARAQRDDELRAAIQRVWNEHEHVYGPRKVWRQLRREKIRTARCTVERLMHEMGLRGTVRSGVEDHDPVRSGGHAAGGSRRSPVCGDTAESALGRGLHVRGDVAWLRVCGLRHRRLRPSDRRLAGVAVAAHRLRPRRARASDLRSARRRRDRPGAPQRRGTQYLSMRYTERLADAGIAPSVGSRGDSYDNALAESIIGLFKTEVIQLKGPWRHLEAVEFATLRWVDWFNNRRLLEPIGYVPPAEFEARYYEQVNRDAMTVHVSHAGALGGILDPAPQSLAQAADRLQGSL